MAELYDVVFYGADNQANSIDETKEKIARLLKVNGSKLEALFNKKGGTTLRKGVSLEVAKKYQQALVKAGGRCRFQQAKPSPVKLALEAVTSEFICTECDYKQVLENNEPAPFVCPECGGGELEHENVVYHPEPESQHESLTYVVTDEGITQMNTRLMAKQQQKAGVIADAVEVEKSTDSHTSKSNVKHLLFSAIAGMTLGGMGVFAYHYYIASNIADELMAEQNVARLAVTEQALKQKNTQQVSVDLKPNQQALMNINQLSLKIADGSIDVNAETAHLPDFMTEVTDKPAPDMENPEQDLTMIALIQRLVEAGQLSQAYQISHAINNPVWRFNWAGKVASAFAADGNLDASGMIWTTLRTETNKMSKVYKRIDKLSQLALFKAEADDLTGAQMLLQNAESLTKNINAPAIKALSLGYIASVQSRIGLQITSGNNFVLANQALMASPNIQARLFAFIELARAYGDAGHKSTALGILNEVLQASKHIRHSTQRSALLGRVAYGLAVAGDCQAAFESITLMDQVSSMDEHLYRIIVEQIRSNRLYSAIETADQFKTAVYQAKAHALLARFFAGTSLSLMIADRFELAIQTSHYISDMARQAVAMSEIARYQVRTGNHQKARQLFAASFTLAQQVGNSYERDNAFEQIARNQALVADIPQAMQTAQQIVDEGLQKLIMEEIQATKKMHRILDSFKSTLD